MEQFVRETKGMMILAMGIRPGSPPSDLEVEEFHTRYDEVIADIEITAIKEIEAYVTLRSCRTYEQLADLIQKREQSNLSGEDYNKLLGALRTRAHRARQKLLKKVSQVYKT